MKTILTTFTTIIILSFFTQAQTQKGDDIDGEAAGDNSGRSVSMPDANTVAIGAPLNDGNGSNAGHVRVFSWDGDAWIQKGEDIDGEAVNDRAGFSVSMPDVNTVAIGAPYNDPNGLNSAGHVRVFSWNGSSWTQKGDAINGEATHDESGYSVSMPDANTIAIGAPYNDPNGLNGAGHVRIFIWDGIEWIQKGEDIEGEAAGDYCGSAVSMPGANTVAVGSPNYEGDETLSGQVRVFIWNGMEWVQQGEDILGNFGAFGASLSMPDVNTLAIGAPYYSGGSYSTYQIGQVRVYNWIESAWVQKGTNIEGAGRENNFGFSLSMSDANTLSVGAPGNNDNGINSGHLRIYKWTGSDWSQEGDDINGEAAYDESGYSVSMADPNTIAIGARWNDGNGSNAGHVRIYAVGIPELPETLNLNDISIPPDPNDCFAASSQITVSDFTVANGGSVILVTGHSGKILLQEGTEVQLGGYLRAWIDVAGNYCDQPESMLAAARNEEILKQVVTENDHSEIGLRVFPNPTKGVFTAELLRPKMNTGFTLRIYNMRGECILQTALAGNTKHSIDLSGKEPGFYLIQLIDIKECIYSGKVVVQ